MTTTTMMINHNNNNQTQNALCLCGTPPKSRWLQHIGSWYVQFLSRNVQFVFPFRFKLRMVETKFAIVAEKCGSALTENLKKNILWQSLTAREYFSSDWVSEKGGKYYLDRNWVPGRNIIIIIWGNIIWGYSLVGGIFSPCPLPGANKNAQKKLILGTEHVHICQRIPSAHLNENLSSHRTRPLLGFQYTSSWTKTKIRPKIQRWGHSPPSTWSSTILLAVPKQEHRPQCPGLPACTHDVWLPMTRNLTW